MLRFHIRATAFALAGILAGFGILASGTTPATAQERVFVTLDHAKILRLGRQAATVILGNPAIADATVFNKSMIVITGKSFGSTNLLILDEQGEEISSNVVTVRSADERLMTVHRGASRESFQCAPNCQRAMTIGDNTEAFEALNSQISSRISISEGNTR